MPPDISHRRRDPGVTTVRCGGDLDLATTSRLQEVLLSPFADGVRGVVADLTGTTFCVSTVFGVLVEAYREALARRRSRSPGRSPSSTSTTCCRCTPGSPRPAAVAGAAATRVS